MVSLEFPHLLRLIEGRQYDTIYHEHYSYLSLQTASDALATAGLTVVDVQELPTHGGSLRVTPPRAPPASRRTGRKGARRRGDGRAAHGRGPRRLRRRRSSRSSATWSTSWSAPGARVMSVAGYGAPGKGNTLLNHCGIREDLLRVHGRPQPAQARDVPARHAHPDPQPGASRRGPARLHRDPAVEPAGARSSHQLSYAREWDAQVRRTHSAVRII